MDCPVDDFEPSGTLCGDLTDDTCDNADTCDGSGVCLPNYEPTTVECRPAAGACDTGEFCDGAGSCPADVLLDGTTCRPAASDCDQAEFCDGISPYCPDDGFIPYGYDCGSDVATGCDNPDICDGFGTCLPNYEPMSTVCRPAVDVCDQEEYCDGAGYCEPDDVIPSFIECRASAGVCDEVEYCDGTNTSCPADQFDTGTVCRVAFGVCDVAESCNGTSVDCPADGVAPATTECRAAAGVCDTAENCDGINVGCPGNSFLSSTTICSTWDEESCSQTTCGGDVLSTLNTKYCSGSAADCSGTTVQSPAVVVDTCDTGTEHCEADGGVADCIACGYLCEDKPDATCVGDEGEACAETEPFEPCDDALFCDSTTTTCELGCSDDSDCTTDPLLPHCDIEFGECVECVDASHCNTDEVCGRETNTCYPMPVPDVGEYLYCWDFDPDSDSGTDNNHCSEFTDATCTYWSPGLWEYVDGDPMPLCGVWPATCAPQQPLPECCLTTQADFLDLPTYDECVADVLCDESDPANYRGCISEGFLTDFVP